MGSANYQLEMEHMLREIPAGTSLLLHACCGPCSSSVLERLAGHFSVTLLYYNPNIWPGEEYSRRRNETRRLLEELPARYPVTFKEMPYQTDVFYEATAGLEQQPEGGARCAHCFRLRLEEAARTAAKQNIPWFTTTLTVSPHKNAALLNKLGGELGEKYGVHFLHSDFKKKDGYKRSLVLSEQYDLYRQSYCGCEFSYRSRHKDE